jgi:hypothetical protein
MIRHEYGNCNTCHVNLGGGGVLTPYGRALSSEVLSTWRGSEKEQAPFWGTFKTPEELIVGGDVRSIQTYRNTDQYSEGNFFVMQGDLEAALVTERFAVDATDGREEIRSGQKSKGKFTSRRHYVQAMVTPGLYVRGGKFKHTFGINTPDHATATKRFLGMDHDTESYNAEVAYAGEQLNVFADGVFGRPDDKDLKKTLDKGAALTGSYIVKSRYKIGASAYQGKNDTSSRRMIGPWLMAGLTKKAFVLFEYDVAQNWGNTKMSGKPMTGFGSNAKEGYEVCRGVNLYLTQDIAKADVSQSKASYEAYGPGMQWFPRPHFELNMQYQKQRLAATQKKMSDFAYLMAHVYL